MRSTRSGATNDAAIATIGVSPGRGRRSGQLISAARNGRFAGSSFIRD
jgi:hypothetical protein